jgi:hypothetical protein
LTYFFRFYFYLLLLITAWCEAHIILFLFSFYVYSCFFSYWKLFFRLWWLLYLTSRDVAKDKCCFSSKKSENLVSYTPDEINVIKLPKSKILWNFSHEKCFSIPHQTEIPRNLNNPTANSNPHEKDWKQQLKDDSITEQIMLCPLIIAYFCWDWVFT